MRAIDADELKKCVLKWLPQDPCGKEEKEMPFETDICVSMLMEIDEQPTIQPEPHEIGYDDCANALLKMWMDNVLTDREYYRIADKLNEKWGKTELPEHYKGVTE